MKTNKLFHFFFSPPEAWFYDSRHYYQSKALKGIIALKKKKFHMELHIYF